MVQNHPVAGCAPYPVHLLLGNIARADANESNHHLACADIEREVLQADPVAWRGLARNGQERLSYDDSLLELNVAGDPEDNDARHVGVNGLPEAAGAGVVEIGDLDDPAAATKS